MHIPTANSCGYFFCIFTLYRSGYFAAAQAACANVYMTRRAVHDSRYALDVRFPCTVAASVGVALTDTKRNAFIAYFALSHSPHLLINQIFSTSRLIIAERFYNCK